MQITTNNQPRELITYNDLPAKYRDDFDYVEGEDRFNYRFFKYKNYYYDTREFMRVSDTFDAYYGVQSDKHNTGVNASTAFGAWHGIQSDTYFSGVLIRYDLEDDSVIVGRYYD